MTRIPASSWGVPLGGAPAVTVSTDGNGNISVDFTDKPPLDEAVICRLVDCTRREDTPDLRFKIMDELDKWHAGRATSEAATTLKALRTKIREIEKLSRALGDALDDLARNRGSEGAAENAYEMLEDRLNGGVSIESAIDAVGWLHTAASAAAAAVPQGLPGRNADLYRADFICNCRKICCDGGFVKDKGGYYGHFLDFVREAMCVVEGRRPSNPAVGRAIEEALKKRPPKEAAP